MSAVIIEFVREAIVLAKKRRKERARVKELFDIALAFNDAHTHTRIDGRWMCPICNKVHEKNGWNVFTGHQFPACCRFEDGHRLYYKEHATTGRTVK